MGHWAHDDRSRLTQTFIVKPDEEVAAMILANQIRGIWTRIIACKAASIALALLGASAGIAPALAQTARSVLVVLDASGSMNAQLPEGRGLRRRRGR
jgi:hypothetical protein